MCWYSIPPHRVIWHSDICRNININLSCPSTSKVLYITRFINNSDKNSILPHHLPHNTPSNLPTTMPPIDMVTNVKTPLDPTVRLPNNRGNSSILASSLLHRYISLPPRNPTPRINGETKLRGLLSSRNITSIHHVSWKTTWWWDMGRISTWCGESRDRTFLELFFGEFWVGRDLCWLWLDFRSIRMEN